MKTKRAKHGTGFLTVAEAAERLGQSRLRVREAAAKGLLDSRRDNEGRLRVDIPGKIKDWGKGELSPDAIIGFLFDELEELEASNADKDARLAALSDLVARQADALDRADRALGDAETRQDRLSELLDRALSHLETQDRAAARMADVSGRALDRLDRLGDDLEASLSQTARFDALLQRALAVAERDTRPDLAPATERAFALLDDALSRAEAAEHVTSKSAAMLERALATGERLQAQVEDHQNTIKAQEKTVETALGMSERALAAATATHQAPPAKRGFFKWLFGI
jgi:hypothetical protein